MSVLQMSGRRWAGVGAACLALLAAPAGAAEQPDKPLLDLGKDAVLKQFVPSAADEVSVARVAGGPGVVVTIHPGKNQYPGANIKPEGAVFNLSAFGHVDARVTNTGTEQLCICLRVDNEGNWQDNPWSAEQVWLKPGASDTIRVRFGYSYGGHPSFKLNPAKVPQLLIFAQKPKTEQSFRIESLVAGGAPGEKPPVNPEDVRTKPAGGVLLGKGSAIDAAKQVVARDAQAQLLAAGGAQSLKMTLPAGKADASVTLKPAIGRWDLRSFLQVVLRVRNAGKAPVTLKARLESGRRSDWVSAPAPVAPGARQELTLPFAGSEAILGDKGEIKAGTEFESDRASGISIAAAGDGERALVVESIRAETPAPPKLPDWLGKRPPVPGEWKQTMDEEFSGKTLNEKIWTIYHPNYWDKKAHFSKHNVIAGGGVLKLRFEKKRGHENDDPTKPETDWQTGFITGTHKWTQRYGYFECRQKLPKAPGMWPAFWMMPDRGEAAGAAREDTANGGMECDILEYLSRYGPYRYNIATHWDGYGKDHKSTGTERLYVQPDKDGYITAGVLWEPGKVTWYAQGKPIACWESPRVASVPMYILFTAVSGGWGGNELTGEGLPDDYVLDYVRCWQRADWAKTP